MSPRPKDNPDQYRHVEPIDEFATRPSETTEFENLAARIYIQQIVLAELCRRRLVSDEVASLFEKLDRAVTAKFGHGSFEALKEALTAFQIEMTKPIMGRD